MNGDPRETSAHPRNITVSHHKMTASETRHQLNLLVIHTSQSDLGDTEVDSGASPDTSNLGRSLHSFVCQTGALSLKRSPSASSFSSSSSSSDSLSSCEDKILTDPRYRHKVEQALKLGYSEHGVTQVLSRLGPDCALNDLLSTLIQLETSDLNLQPLLPPTDDPFTNDGMDYRRPVSGDTCLLSEERFSFSTCGDLQRGSKNSIGLSSSFSDANSSHNLCHIIIDGSNVAMSHGKSVFSCKGIQIAVDWFRGRGHSNITVFVPQWRKESSQPETPITDQDILYDLENQGIVVFTPSRRVNGRRVVCYDDRYILKLAADTAGIVVSNDVYRDLVSEKDEFRQVVDQRLLMYTFVNDRFMPPEDPLGRLGPTLDNFLRKTSIESQPKPQECPYGKKCTYGNKCRFHHPKRGFFSQKSVSDTLKEQAHVKLQDRATKIAEIAEREVRPKQKLTRTKSLVVEPSMSPVSSDESRAIQWKPKQGHVLLSPKKSSDYLNEPRKRLEEAEQAAALERSHEALLKLQTEGCLHGDSNNSSISKNPSFSTTPHKDVVKQTTSAAENQLKLACPLKPLSTHSSQASPSRLTIPTGDSPQGYLSGHLYLAKKLSDESNEGSFFSEHTSSASSTRASSPIVSSGKITEQMQICKVDTSSRGMLDDSARCFTVPAQFHSAVLLQQPPYTSQVDQHPPVTNIPNFSIFPDGTSWRSHKCDTGITTSADRCVSADSVHSTDVLFQSVSPLSPDSGRFSSEYISSPYHSQLDNPLQPHKSYPLSRAEETMNFQQQQQQQQQHSLHRMYSSIDNVRTGVDSLGRRLSGLAVSDVVGDHCLLKQQNSMPAHLKANTGYPPPGLNRQNSSSDPQISNISGLLRHQDGLSSNFGPEYSVKNFKGSNYSPSHQHDQHKSLQHRQFEHQDLLRIQQHDRGEDSPLLVSHLLRKPLMDSWVQQANPDYAPSQCSASQRQYRPQQSTLSFHDTSSLSHFPGGISPQNMMEADPRHDNRYYLQHPTHFTPPRTMHSGMFAQAPPGLHSLPPVYGLSPSSPYSQVNNLPHKTSQSFQLPIKSAVSSRDSPILPDNPSYPIYYHLSNVFGEQVVRTVLNLNPGVHNADQICKLILKFKDETGS